jgi:capsular exopolysaccharide synthesis family protein
VSKFFKALENAERERAARGDEQSTVNRDATVEEKPTAAARPATVATPPRPPVRTATAETVPPAPATVQVTPPRPAMVEVGPSPVTVVEGRTGEPVSLPPYGAPIRTDILRGLRKAARDGDPTVFHATGELDDHLVSVLQPTSPAAEQYRAVRLYLETLRRERGFGVVAISSARRGDGKTLTSLNLAGTLAQAADTRVALVEVDMRRPAVARYLGLSNARGLSTHLLGDGPGVESLLERPTGIGFTVVLAGPPIAMPYELLQSPRLRELFATLRERFDHVIVDTPPALPFPDVGILRDVVDGFLVVVRAHRTPRETVQEALTTVGPDHALGVIFNDDERLMTTAGYGVANGRSH